MKKLLSFIGCLICIHSFSQTPVVGRAATSSDEKMLMRAIATMMNPESNKKTPDKSSSVFYSNNYNDGLIKVR